MEKQEVYRNSDTIDLVQLVKVLLKRKWLIILGTLAFTLAALVISLVLPKVYLGEGFIGLSSGIDIDLDITKYPLDKPVVERCPWCNRKIRILKKNRLIPKERRGFEFILTECKKEGSGRRKEWA